MFTWEVNKNGNKNDATNVLSEIKLYWTFHKTLTYCFCFVLHHGISTEGTDLSELEATVQSSWNWTLGSRWDRLKNGDSSSVYNNELPLLTPLEFATFATARGRWAKITFGVNITDFTILFQLNDHFFALQVIRNVMFKCAN